MNFHLKIDQVAYVFISLPPPPVHPRFSLAGDAENDVEMLRLAGVGVCVGNASPPARAAARFMAPTNANDGSAVAMEQLLQSKEPPAGEE